jgi:CBS-domain-containing membrane protein
MQNKVTWASPDDSLQQALAKMQQTDAGYIMIGQNGVLEGIVSHSDITRAMSPYLQPIFAKWRQPLDDATLKIRIKWIMSRPVRTIKPETSLAASMEYMSQFRGRCLPVTDEQGNVQGLVTAFDIIQALLKSSSDTFAAGETAQALVESAATAGTT